jgi:hypothetical protein
MTKQLSEMSKRVNHFQKEIRNEENKIYTVDQTKSEVFKIGLTGLNLIFNYLIKYKKYI